MSTRLKRWYWVMDEKTQEPIPRAGQLDDTFHTMFEIDDIEDADVKVEVLKAFKKRSKSLPFFEFVEKQGPKNRNKIVVTEIIGGKDN